jgi:hypothetical protein
MSGGVFSSSPLVRRVFTTVCVRNIPMSLSTPGVIEPVRGALALARKGAVK